MKMHPSLTPDRIGHGAIVGQPTVSHPATTTTTLIGLPSVPVSGASVPVSTSTDFSTTASSSFPAAVTTTTTASALGSTQAAATVFKAFHHRKSSYDAGSPTDTCSTPPPIARVPEPSGVVLALSGPFALAMTTARGKASRRDG